MTLMVHLNGELARYANPLFSSWSAHGTGTVAALLLLAILYRPSLAGPESKTHAPFWAYLGGVAGAATVVLTSIAVNSPLALSGTLALGLTSQMVFSLAADHWGLFGMPRRVPGLREFVALGLVLAGSMLIIMFGLTSA